jgi:methyl-accepting chemotaxis protein
VVIRELDERSQFVATAVAQQSEVAAENARMFGSVLQVSSVVADSTERIGASDERSSSAAKEMLRASSELSAMSARLARIVGQFQV